MLSARAPYVDVRMRSLRRSFLIVPTISAWRALSSWWVNPMCIPEIWRWEISGIAPVDRATSLSSSPDHLSSRYFKPLGILRPFDWSHEPSFLVVRDCGSAGLKT